jgi:hypothetical protein
VCTAHQLWAHVRRQHASARHLNKKTVPSSSQTLCAKAHCCVLLAEHAHEEGAYEQQEEGNRDQGTENGKRVTVNDQRALGDREQKPVVSLLSIS